MWKTFALKLHGEWSEFADECSGLNGAILLRHAEQESICGI